MEKILLIGLEEESEIRKIAQNMRIQVRSVTRDEYDKTPSQLLKEKTTAKSGEIKTKEAGEQTQESLLLFCGVTDKHVDRILFELRKRKIPVTYKAVMTDTNQNWTIQYLMLQMEQERRMYEASAGK